MKVEELWTICPPVRPLTNPHQLNKDINNLKLKQANQPHELPVFVDSKDLINLLKKQVKSYKEFSPFDLLTLIHSRKTEFENNNKYYFRISKPIHYGYYGNEQFFQVRSDRVTDIDDLDNTYNQKIEEAKVIFQTELRTQIATYYDILTINRRLLPFNLRAMNRPTDRKLIVFKYDWANNKLL
jgi:hypothetical protein